MTRKIISASRRSDIPAFYSRWLLRRLEEGYCDFLHPFTGRFERVSLLPEDCLCIVLWTRNPAPLSTALPDLLATLARLREHDPNDTLLWRPQRLRLRRGRES